jgi:cytochrome c peroxidase
MRNPKALLSRVGPATLLALVTLACSGGRPAALGPEVFAPPDESYAWRLPPGFPPPPVPPDNRMSEARVELGRRLFHDPRLSLDETVSCATCHRQELAFTDGRARAVGVTGELHPRSAMSLANVAYNASFTWADGELTSLERQMLTPMFGTEPVEMGLAGLEEELLERLAADPYPELFRRAFPDQDEPLNVDNVVRAIASFERILVSGRSDWDRFVFDDDPEALTPAARRGMRLFFSDEIGCHRCHAEITFSGPIVLPGQPAHPTFHNTALYDLDGRGAYPESDRGLYDRTGRAADMGQFRAPTLRNVAVTAPYMHDGSIATLQEVVDHYAAGGRARTTHPASGRPTRHSPLLTGFALESGERADLVAFLEALTDESFLTDPRFSAPD